MTLLLFCAVGWGVGLAFDLFALVVVVAIAAPLSVVLRLDAGLAGAIWTGLCVTTSLQFGFVGGLVSRRMTGPLRALRTHGFFQRRRG